MRTTGESACRLDPDPSERQSENDWSAWRPQQRSACTAEIRPHQARVLRQLPPAGIFPSASPAKKKKAAREAGHVARWRLIVRAALEFVTGKEIAQFELRSVFGVRAMDRVLFDRRRELLADRAFFRIRRIGRTHQLSQVRDGILFFECENNDGTRRHE